MVSTIEAHIVSHYREDRARQLDLVLSAMAEWQNCIVRAVLTSNVDRYATTGLLAPYQERFAAKGALVLRPNYRGSASLPSGRWSKISDLRRLAGSPGMRREDPRSRPRDAGGLRRANCRRSPRAREPWVSPLDVIGAKLVGVARINRIADTGLYEPDPTGAIAFITPALTHHPETPESPPPEFF